MLVVPAESKFQTLSKFMTAWKANPGGTPIAGGTDHITVGLLARAGGIDTAKINYVPYAGGGEALSSSAFLASSAAVSREKIGSTISVR